MDDLTATIARVQAHATALRTHRKPRDMADRSLCREWWTVKRGESQLDVFFCPPQSWDAVAAWYPDAEVAPI